MEKFSVRSTPTLCFPHQRAIVPGSNYQATFDMSYFNLNGNEAHRSPQPTTPRDCTHGEIGLCNFSSGLWDFYPKMSKCENDLLLCTPGPSAEPQESYQHSGLVSASFPCSPSPCKPSVHHHLLRLLVALNWPFSLQSSPLANPHSTQHLGENLSNLIKSSPAQEPQCFFTSASPDCAVEPSKPSGVFLSTHLPRPLSSHCPRSAPTHQ